MALPITRTPVIFDPSLTNFERETAYDNGFGSYGTIWGPFRYDRSGSVEFYFVIVDNCITGAGPLFHVVRSVGHFTSWTREDEINNPCNPTAIGAGSVIAFYPASENGIISICYPKTSTAMGIVEFNCSTNLYGTPSSDAPVSAFRVSRGTQLFKQTGSNDYWVFYCRLLAPIGVYYIVLSGGTAGSWGSETLIASLNAAGNSQMNGGVMDTGTGDMVISYSDFASYPTGLSTNELKVDNIGTVVGPSAITPAFTTTGIHVIWSGKILIPFFDLTDGKVKVASGTPLSGPSWTITDLDGPYSPLGFVIGTDFTAFLDKDGNARITWTKTDSSANGKFIYMVENSGSGWGSPDLVYDYVANPPIVPGFTPGANGPHATGAIQLSDGTWMFGTAIDLDGGCFPCAGFAITDVIESDPVEISFALHGGVTDLISVNPIGPPPPPGPVTNPTECINQE